MKNRLLTMAGGLAMLAILGHFYAKPLLAQVRAALVSSIDEPGRIPYTVALPFSLNAGSMSAATAPTIPSNKRLVITFVSGLLGGTGAGLTPIDVLEFSAGQNHRGVVLIHDGLVSQSTQIYFNAGETPVAASSFNTPNGILVVSGYLLDCTAAACAALAP
jgi:hypothetical protein